MLEFDPLSLLLLLTDSPPPGAPGDAPPPGAPGEASPAPNGEDPPPPGLFGPGFFFIVLGVLVLMIIMSIMGQRRERKKREELINSIKKHDKVQTIGGVVGSIVDVKPDTVVLKVDEASNTRITFARSAVQQVIKSASGSEQTEKQEM